MQEYDGNPLVSVAVVTYNSSKTVVETLDSILMQTYQNLELVISDDCSIDDTVGLCKKWIDEHNGRFARAELLVSSINTGIAGNLNRAEDACRGEWIKSIAGDDLLMPNCIEVCISYVKNRADVVYLFGKCKAFGSTEKQCHLVDKKFDYKFFTKSSEEQLHQLIFENNCVPATTVFMHREKAIMLGVRNDERISLIEDFPKWINLLKKGVRFHFINETLVKYRVGGISTMNNVPIEYYKSNRLMFFTYQYPMWLQENIDEAIRRVVSDEILIYSCYVEAIKDAESVRDSKAYRLGKFLLRPYSAIRKWILRIIKK